MTARTLSRSTSPPRTPARRGAEDLWTEVAEDEVGDALVVLWRGGLELVGAARLGGVRCAGGFAEEMRAFERGEVGGDHHAHAVGDGDEPAVTEDVGDAAGVVRRDKMLVHAEFAYELAGPGLFGDPAVWAALDDEAVALDGFDGAAEALGGLEEDGVHVALGAVALGELPGGGDAGHAAAEDGNADWRLPGHAIVTFSSTCAAHSPRATSARVRTRMGESFRLSARQSWRPSSRAVSVKATSMS
jgi:hypothetical protein